MVSQYVSVHVPKAYSSLSVHVCVCVCVCVCALFASKSNHVYCMYVHATTSLMQLFSMYILLLCKLQSSLFSCLEKYACSGEQTHTCLKTHAQCVQVGVLGAPVMYTCIVKMSDVVFSFLMRENDL